MAFYSWLFATEVVVIDGSNLVAFSWLFFFTHLVLNNNVFIIIIIIIILQISQHSVIKLVSFFQMSKIMTKYKQICQSKLFMQTILAVTEKFLLEWI